MPRIKISHICLTVVFIVFGLSGCDLGLLDVDIPDKVDAGVIEDPGFAETMVLGAQRDFNCYYSNYVRGSASFTDELYASTEFTANNEVDTRNLPATRMNTEDCVGGAQTGFHLPMHRAIFTNDQAVRQLEGFSDSDVPDKANMIAKASSFAGFALTMQGEGYCRGVAEENGPALTPTEVLAEAEKRFDKAINLATEDEILNMARVGRARARLGQGKLEAAASDAKNVPKGYIKYVEYSQASPDTENQVYVVISRNQYLSVEPQLRDLQMLNGVSDPRIQLTDLGRSGPDGRTPLWKDDQYSDSGSPILLASWEEAQLIIAEAERGQVAVDRINALRDQHDLPNFNSTDEDEILNQIVEERQRELHLTGHRLGDKIRLNLKWKQGANHKDSFTYGNQYCIPLAQTEINQNPNISE